MGPQNDDIDWDEENWDQPDDTEIVGGDQEHGYLTAEELGWDR
jgi:hypothetical protein